MKKLLGFVWIFFVLGETHAQTVFTDLKSLRKRADYYYSNLAYAKAADLYAQALKKKKNKGKYELNCKAADLFQKMSRFEDAKVCFENIIASGHRFTSEDSIHYFNVLRAVGDPKADTLFTRHYSRRILNNLFRDSLYYTIFELPFNTERSEYCPVVVKDGIFFVTEEEDTSMVKKYNALNNGGFARLYYAAKTDTGWGIPSKIDTEEEGLLHIGPVSFYNGTNAIVNMCLEGSTQPYRLQLFSSEFNEDNKAWTYFSSLRLNNPSYSIGHPAISQDGHKLFFVSDKEGGYGGTDIYVSELKGGSWSEPRNLGSKVNTRGDEKYPFLTEDSVLFFSSNGRYGMGGLDIFYTDLFFKDTIVVNMGYPVNSELDDFGFSYHKESKAGYFSSNRKSSGDDLFMYTENKIFLDITLYDDFDKKDLKEYTIEILDEELLIPIRYITGEKENIVKANLRPFHNYRLIVHKEDYKDDTLVVSTYNMEASTNKISSRVYLKRKPVYYASLKFKNELSKENFEGALILVYNRTENTLDTLDHDAASAIIKLNGECEYIITSKNGEKLRYIFVERKIFKITATIPFYNLYLGTASPSILHVKIQKCDKAEVPEEVIPDVKVWDWVNRNEFLITPGPQGDFQLVVTDARLFDLYVDDQKINYSKSEVKVDNYCVKFIENK